MRSYLILSAFIAAMVCFISIFTFQTIEKSIRSESLTKIGHVADALDNHVLEIKSSANLLVMSDDVIAIASARNGLRPFHIYAGYNLVDELRYMEIVNNRAEIYIYFGNESFVISENGRNSARDFYDGNNYEISYQEWINILSTQYNPEFKIFRESGISYVEYWMPLQGHSEKFKSGVAVFRVKEESVQLLFNNLKWSEEETIVVLDENKTILFSSQSQSHEPSIIPTQTSQNENQIIKDDFVISRADSSVANWSFYSVLPRSYLVENTKYIQQILIICAALVLTFLAVYLVLGFRNNYIPIHNIFTMLHEKEDDDQEKNAGNNLRVIERSVKRILSDYDYAKLQLDAQIGIMQNNLLVKLLTNRYENILSRDDSMNFYEIVFKGNCFLVFIIDFKTNLEFHIPDPSPEEINNVFIRFFQLKNYSIYGADHNGFAVCMMSFEEQEDVEADLKQITNMLKQGQKKVREDYLVTSLIGISNLYKSIDDIADAYMEAITVIDYLNFIGERTDIIMKYEKLHDKNEKGEYHYPSKISVLNQLTNLILAKQFPEAATLSTHMLEGIIAQDYDVKMGTCFKYSIINAIIDGLSGLQEKDFPESGRIYIDIILSSDSIPQLQKNIESVFSKLSSHNKCKSDEIPRDLLLQIKTYIQENYSDSSLSVTQIAEVFNLKVPFVSKFFKKYSNTGLLDYITQLRLQKIKYLLLQTKLNLNDIAKRTGFINSNALIRTFKRYEGITPGTYKDVNAKQEKIGEKE